jgi:tetratricopeptide (TPR) repeat protein
MSASKPFVRIGLTLAIVLALSQATLRGDEVDRRRLYVQQIKGCAGIITAGGPASGWVVDVEKRWIVTCQHVVGTGEEIEVVFPVHKEGRVVQDREWYIKSANRVKGKVISADPKRDLAIVQVETLPEGTKALPLAEGSGQPGDNLYLIGNPVASGAMWIYSIGSLRAVYQKRFTYKQTAHEVDALIGETQLPGNPGDSGGAVFGDNGAVLGVHCGGTPEGAQLLSTYIDVVEIRAFLKEPLKGVASAKTFDDYFKRGNDHYNKGALDKALKDYEECIRIRPDSSDAYRCRAGVYIRKKQYDAAFKDAQEAVRLDPNNAAAHNERAVCHGAKSDYKAALEDYNDAVRLNPKEAMFWAGRAWTFNNLKQHDKAALDASEAIKLSREFAFAYSERGLAHLNLKQYQKATSDLDQALKLEPKTLEARYHRGAAQAALGNYKEAIADFTEVLRRSSDHALALKARGNAHLKMDAFDKAVRDFDKYVGVHANDAEVYAWRSRCHQALGNQALAEADSRRAAELRVQ